jgi:predicted helicase
MRDKLAAANITCVLPQSAAPDSFFVTLLDPATGTGTFLEVAIDVIYEHLRDKWQRHGHAVMPRLPNCSSAFASASFETYWSAYVTHALLPRLYGFEIMMASYTVAHLKIGLKLRQTGYDFKSGERLRIFLTNTLEPPIQLDELAGIAMHFLSQESRAAAIVKSSVPITVITGNPPYSGHSANKNAWSEQLLKQGYTRADGSRDEGYYILDGKSLGEKNPKYLQDDYVKFIRFAQWMTDRTGIGLVGMITNHSYLDNPTFRGMRRSLMNSYEHLRLLDLHGNAKKKETAPNGGKDENVFNIQQGVAIALMLNKGNAACRVEHADLFGTRSAKHDRLATATMAKLPWRTLAPQAEFYLFVPQDADALAGYNRFPKITEIMPVSVNGFKTHRDEFAIGFDRAELHKRIAEMRGTALSDEEFRHKYGVKDSSGWTLGAARAKLRKLVDWEKHLILCLYRPFDWRWCYFSDIAMDRPRRELLDHVAGKENLCIALSRQQGTIGFRHAIVSRDPANDCLISNLSREADHVFPLSLYIQGAKSKLNLSGELNTVRL